MIAEMGYSDLPPQIANLGLPRLPGAVSAWLPSLGVLPYDWSARVDVKRGEFEIMSEAVDQLVGVVETQRVAVAEIGKLVLLQNDAIVNIMAILRQSGIAK